ncbi:RecX family transcriptional regulator [Anaerocolumna sp. AGMB13025]|uniref:regulatory protein RecX n=1 Tax=Anaerocolumna sp. AGMB13025 TaxID=3039116 RepID=UPI00241C3831|nr:RecX family transcriptional regulator [Anaerocolumna sp. AGMB13025]WFR54830.1 RecX family transcriptional regulator [Anaerocolumna sp. AGMB13025]
MIITKIEKLDKGKVKVYIDQEFKFCLYEKDLKIHQIKEDAEISEMVYRDIYNNTVLRRAKQKALAVLKFMDRTEAELILKLKQADYTDPIISDVLTYINSYHYIDDERYASSYIRSKKDIKSKRQIYAELVQKGIDKGNIDQAFSEEYDNEESAILRAVAKKSKSVKDMTYEEKTKLIASLYRKGFQLDLIKKIID